jgi:hypothetical protein
MIRCALPLILTRGEGVEPLRLEPVELLEQHPGSTTTPSPITGVTWG